MSEQGSVSALWRFPVKSMQGERVDALEVTAAGAVGDRAYALIERDTGRLVTARSFKHFPALLACRAAYVAPPRAGGEPGAVRITLADGRVVTSDAPDVDDALSAHFGRAVTLAHRAPDDCAIDMYYPDVEGSNPKGYRDEFQLQRIGAAYFAQHGRPSPVPPGSFLDQYPLSLLTTSTLARLAELAPGSQWDERRFRMNVIVATTAPGFVENAWAGQALAIGELARLAVTIPDPRCVMVTLAQDDLPKDLDVLRALVAHNRLELGTNRMPCAGVYAGVSVPGTLRVGDRVVVG